MPVTLELNSRIGLFVYDIVCSMSGVQYCGVYTETEQKIMCATQRTCVLKKGRMNKYVSIETNLRHQT